jgi:hypothetical protein
MARSARAGSDEVQSDAGPGMPAKRRSGKRSTKPARKNKESSNMIGSRAAKKSDGGSGIRETEEARALLTDQLNSLYWWVFNAFKMKGFIRAKALDELQRGDANGSGTRLEQCDSAEAHASPEKQTS